MEIPAAAAGPTVPAVVAAPSLPAPPAPFRSLFARKPVYAFAVCLGVVVPLMAMTVARPARVRKLEWHSLKDRVQARATTDVSEDFRQDLRRWAGKEGLPKDWTLMGNGFAIPGQLALQISSVPLADYRMEFVGQIDKKGLGFVYRAMDFDNYYAARIVIVKEGLTPDVILERYAVIDGQDGPKTQTRLPFDVRMDTLYTVQVEVNGDHFVTRINGQFVDGFSDNQLHSGGVGFFSGPGEAARICRLHLSGRDDLLGKLCSLLTPVA